MLCFEIRKMRSKCWHQRKEGAFCFDYVNLDCFQDIQEAAENMFLCSSSYFLSLMNKCEPYDPKLYSYGQISNILQISEVFLRSESNTSAYIFSLAACDGM